MRKRNEAGRNTPGAMLFFAVFSLLIWQAPLPAHAAWCDDNPTLCNIGKALTPHPIESAKALYNGAKSGAQSIYNYATAPTPKLNPDDPVPIERKGPEITGNCGGAPCLSGDAQQARADAAAGKTASQPTKLSNPLGTTSIPALFGRAITIITGISGSLALLMFVYGGFTWVTSQGSPEKIKKGKQIFITATLGLFIIFGAYTLVSVVLRAIGGGAI